jgi:Ca2+-binding EF-hand superfamily protein
MKMLGTLTVALALAGTTLSVLAANDAQPSDQKREQMHEQCKANPQECRERMQKHMQEWFKRVDKDSDGSISREEAQANAPRMAQHFDEIDANHDGKVTPEEMKAHHQKMREQHRAEHGSQDSDKKQ